MPEKFEKKKVCVQFSFPKQPKDKAFGQDIPGTSGTHTSGYPWPWDVPDKDFMQGAFFCCFRQGLARMSRDLGRNFPGSEKLYI